MNLDSILRRDQEVVTVLSLVEYLESFKSDLVMQLNAAGRVRHAIGPATEVDTSKDSRLGIIFNNRTIKTYATFADFFGIEETIMSIVQFFENASKGLVEEGKILYLLGPVGSGKSSINERILNLFEQVPMYVLAFKNGTETPVPSPILESPLGIFNPSEHGDILEERYKIPRHCLTGRMSRWAAEHVNKYGYSQFVVMQMKPSRARRIGIANVEPADSDEARRGALIGLAHKSGRFEDYHYSGALNRTTQGIMSFSEIFDAHPAQINPLKSASVDRKYSGDGAVGELPYYGVIIAHSNEAAWNEMLNDDTKENLRDRIYKIDVPYNVRLSAEIQQYDRYLESSGLAKAPRTPRVLEMPARFAVLSRISEPSMKHVTRIDKMRVYDGSDHCSGKDRNMALVDSDQLRADAKWRDGMSGIPTRFMRMLLTNAAQADAKEPGLDPVLMMRVGQQMLERNTVPGVAGVDVQAVRKDATLCMREIIGNAVRRAYVENFDLFIENALEKYFKYADAHLEQERLVDPETQLHIPQEDIERHLFKIEKAMGITSPKDFRRIVVKAALRSKAKQMTLNAAEILVDHWQAFVAAVTPSRDDMLPIVRIMYRDVGSKEAKAHAEFMTRLCKEGYTQRQAYRAVEWFSDDKNWK